MSNLQTSSFKIPPHVVAWLSAEGWTAEELSFLENEYDKHCIRVEDLNYNSHDYIANLMKVSKRFEAQKGERAREYDSKNNYQGKDSPEWFRASIDRDLFK